MAKYDVLYDLLTNPVHRSDEARHTAAVQNELNRLRYGLEVEEVHYDQKTTNSSDAEFMREHSNLTPLILIANDELSYLVSPILSRGVDPHFKNNHGFSALMIATIKGEALFLEELLRCMGSAARIDDVSKKIHGNFSAFELAIQRGHVEVVAQLANKGAKIDLNNFAALEKSISSPVMLTALLNGVRLNVRSPDSEELLNRLHDVLEASMSSKRKWAIALGIILAAVVISFIPGGLVLTAGIIVGEILAVLTSAFVGWLIGLKVASSQYQQAEISYQRASLSLRNFQQGEYRSDPSEYKSHERNDISAATVNKARISAQDLLGNINQIADILTDNDVKSFLEHNVELFKQINEISFRREFKNGLTESHLRRLESINRALNPSAGLSNINPVALQEFILFYRTISILGEQKQEKPGEYPVLSSRSPSPELIIKPSREVKEVAPDQRVMKLVGDLKQLGMSIDVAKAEKFLNENQSTFGHTRDPLLRGILEKSLTREQFAQLIQLRDFYVAVYSSDKVQSYIEFFAMAEKLAVKVGYVPSRRLLLPSDPHRPGVAAALGKDLISSITPADNKHTTSTSATDSSGNEPSAGNDSRPSHK